jgi:hypothetical protein
MSNMFPSDKEIKEGRESCEINNGSLHSSKAEKIASK